MKGVTQDSLLKKITENYLKSDQYNGTSLAALLREVDKETGVECLVELINKDLVSVIYGDFHPNPHIKALPDEPKESQIAKLYTDKFKQGCVYSLKKYLETVVDKSEFSDRPFELCLALGEPQLAYKPFELSVLEYYRNDPRYYYQEDGISGSICIGDEDYKKEDMKESDKILLETFGFGYNEDLSIRAVVVFLRYLSNLSPEHQQIWKGKELSETINIHPGYYETAVLGRWPERGSIFAAFIEELRIINDMAKCMGRPPFFRKDFRDIDKPKEFAFLLRPTLKEYNDFILLLDKLISDNIKIEFFNKEVSIEYEEIRKDGKVVLRHKGSLRILEEWIETWTIFEGKDELRQMFEVLRKVRRARMNPAHEIDENVFDQQYYKKQRELMKDVYIAVKTIRTLFGGVPMVKSKDIEISEYVREGKIWHS
ncbi:MAG: AAA family ATPase [Deltaproteobacteria bacterium]|nr:AAA family ATPase [Deltaproteobacteria bacterium]